MAAASVQHQQQNGQIIGLNNTVNHETTDLDAKMFVVKKANDSQGITALISRQLQGNIYKSLLFKYLRLLLHASILA